MIQCLQKFTYSTIFKNFVTRNNIFAFYWSSTTVATKESSVWGVEFYYGYFDDAKKSSSYWVRCVRGGE